MYNLFCVCVCLEITMNLMDTYFSQAAILVP